jgi:predicted nucleic acid-binding protein
MRFLLDTNVISEVRRTKPDPHVRAWIAGLSPGQVFFSALTIGELRRGAARLRTRDEDRAAGFDSWVDELEDDYGERILPVTLEIATRWGRLELVRPLPVVDTLIAATAIVHGLTVATRNTKDFADTGVPVYNPFPDSGM